MTSGFDWIRERFRQNQFHIRKIPSGNCLPCGGSQACPIDGIIAMRGYQEQCSWHIQDCIRGVGKWLQALCPDQHGQGGQSHEYHGGFQAVVRNGRPDNG